MRGVFHRKIKNKKNHRVGGIKVQRIPMDFGAVQCATCK